MNKPTVLLLVAAAMLARDSVAQKPAASAKPADAKVVIPPLVDPEALPRFDAEPLPQEKSKAPRPAEWNEAPRVRLTRMSPRIGECEARRLREWIRIHCDRQMAGARLIAGSTEGIELWIAEPLPGDPNGQFGPSEGRFVDVVFPLRSGDRRVFELFDLVSGYESAWPKSSMIIEEQWLEGGSPEIAVLAP